MHLRQVEIENNHSRPARVRFSYLAEEPDRLLAIPGDVKLAGDAVLNQGLPEQEDVSRIVFRNKNSS